MYVFYNYDTEEINLLFVLPGGPYHDVHETPIIKSCAQEKTERD